MTPEALAEMQRLRTEATDAIIQSPADKKLIVAGPGTATDVGESLRLTPSSRPLD
jgi:hypothetical protein